MHYEGIRKRAMYHSDDAWKTRILQFCTFIDTLPLRKLAKRVCVCATVRWTSVGGLGAGEMRWGGGLVELGGINVEYGMVLPVTHVCVVTTACCGPECVTSFLSWHHIFCRHLTKINRGKGSRPIVSVLSYNSPCMNLTTSSYGMWIYLIECSYRYAKW